MSERGKSESGSENESENESESESESSTSASESESESERARERKSGTYEGISPDGDNENPNITLICNEGESEQSFEVSRKAMSISDLVVQSLEQDVNADNIPIPYVKPSSMKYVVEYAKYHDGGKVPDILKPLQSTDMAHVVADKWDAEFIDEVAKGNKQKLYDLILAANYMDIPSLLNLGCAKVASLVQGQPLERIKDILAVEK